MKRKSIFGVATLAFAVVIGLTAFKADKPSDDNRCCPEGWTLICNTAGITNNISKDNNDDGC